MKIKILPALMTFVSLNASALQLICESPQRNASGKSAVIYRFNSVKGSMERFAYLPSSNAYTSFGDLENLVFSDNLYNMVPLKREIIAKSDDQVILKAIWRNGNLEFKANIYGEGSKLFSCKLKE